MGGDEVTNSDALYLKSKAALRTLLPRHPGVAERLALVGAYGRLIARHDAWWQSASAKKLRQAATSLVEALDALDYYERLDVQEVFNAESIHIFRGVPIPDEWKDNPRLREIVDAHVPQIDFIDKFAAQVRFLSSAGKRAANRPKEHARLQLAVEVARELVLGGIKPPASEDGVFAEALSIVLPAAGMKAPDYMFGLTQMAIAELKKLAKHDADLQRALREAAPLNRPKRRQRSPVRR